MYLLPNNFHEPDPPAPFKYLKNGLAYPIRPEKRGNNVYWFMRKMRGGKTAVVYLGPVGSLSRDLLDNAVTEATTQLQGETSQ